MNTTNMDAPRPVIAVLDITKSDGPTTTIVRDMEVHRTNPRKAGKSAEVYLRYAAELSKGTTLDRVRFSHGTVAELEDIAKSGASAQDIGRFSRLTGADVAPVIGSTRSDLIGPHDELRASVKVSTDGEVDLTVKPAGARGRKSNRETL